LASQATSSEIAETSYLLSLHGSLYQVHWAESTLIYIDEALQQQLQNQDHLRFKPSEEEAAKRCGSSAQAPAGQFRSCSVMGPDMAWRWGACAFFIKRSNSCPSPLCKEGQSHDQSLAIPDLDA
jgi:hypothetical protein